MILNNDYRFDIQLQEGREAEDYFAAIVGARLYEVKFDQRALDTGNVYVEYEDNPGHNGWKPTVPVRWHIPQVRTGRWPIAAGRSGRVECGPS